MKGVWGLRRTIIDGDQEYYEISSIYECVTKLSMNDLFGIKLTFLWSE